MLDIRSELEEVYDLCERSNINILTLVNVFGRNFLNIIGLLKPKFMHYIGHSTERYLIFRHTGQINAEDIINEYKSNVADFIFLNSCQSYSIAYDLGKCSIVRIGYRFNLLNIIATTFTKNLYKEIELNRLHSELDRWFPKAIDDTTNYIKDKFKDSSLEQQRDCFKLVEYYYVYPDINILNIDNNID